MGTSFDLDRTLGRVRRRLTWYWRLDLAIRGLLIGAGGALVVIAWHAVADPRLSWRLASSLALAAGLLPYVTYGLKRRISTTSAAWFLDRKLTAGGRILTLLEHRRAEDPGETPFLPRIETEVSGLLRDPWSPAWSKPIRRLPVLAGIVIAAALVLLLGPDTPVAAPTPGSPPTWSATIRHAPALERLAAELRARGEAALAERLAQAARRLARGEAPDPATERLLDELEERLRRHGVIVTLRIALGDSPAGRALARSLLGSDGAGDGVAVTAPGASKEQIALLQKAARLPGLPDALERELGRALAALQSGNREAFDVAAADLREQIGREAPADLLAESVERLAALKDGAATSGASRRPAPGELRPRRAEKPGPTAKPEVRGEPGTSTVLDPNLRRVIRRYFASRGQEHE